MLVSDLDGTLVGDPAAYSRFEAWWSSRRAPGLLVYNTGRSRASAEALIAELDLPWPDALICGVGTEVVFGRGQPGDLAWNRYLDQDWSRRAVLDASDRLDPRLLLQAPIAQSPLKVSFVIQDREAPAQIKALLARIGVRTRLQVTDDKLLDILPFRAGKRAATEFVRRHFGVPHGDTVACGDGDNDLDMLTAGWPAVAVANASPSLKGEAGRGQLFLATSAAADGILEGLAHFGW